MLRVFITPSTVLISYSIYCEYEGRLIFRFAFIAIVYSRTTSTTYMKSMTMGTIINIDMYAYML